MASIRLQRGQGPQPSERPITGPGEGGLGAEEGGDTRLPAESRPALGRDLT